MATEFIDVVRDWLTAPVFTMGGNPVTALRLVSIAVAMLAIWWLSVLIEASLQRLAARGAGQALSASALYTLGRIVRYSVLVIGTLIALSFFGVDFTNLAIVGGAIGVGVGIGLQNLFANLVSGIVILLEKTLKVGDFVDLQSGVVGRVTEISMRYTRVTTNDLVDIIVPNSEFTNGRVINWSYGENNRRIHVPFGVAYGSDKVAVREAGIAAARLIKGTIDEEGRRPDVWLVSFGDSSLNFELVVWVTDQLLMSPGATNAKYMWAIEDELRKHGIEIPFPQRDLHLRSGSVRIERAPGGDTVNIGVSAG